MRKLVALALAGGLVFGGCSSDDGASKEARKTDSLRDGSSLPTETSLTIPPSSAAPNAGVTDSNVPIDQVKVRLKEIGRFDQPLAIVARAGHEALYVGERGGRIRVVDRGKVLADSLIDISQETTTGGERGLLGIAFSPDGTRLYLSFTDLRGNSRLDEVTMGQGALDIDVGSRRTLLKVNQPYSNHNGGHVAFGPDGMLYFGLGDGGSGGDPGNRAQNTKELLGKILRIDPRSQGDAPYGIPPDNPFANGSPNQGRGEIWAYGLRNPWRFSFDRANGDLWIGDVGQDEVEEIDWLKAGTDAGANLGWNRLEGSRAFEGTAPVDAVGPFHEYSHSVGQAVTGGFVYRGSRIPALVGRYLFGDLNPARLWALERTGQRQTKRHDLGVGVDEGTLVSFGEDLNGELYVVSIGGSVYRLDPF